MTTQFLRLGVCRTQIPSIRTPRHSLPPFRSLSSFPSCKPPLRTFVLAHRLSVMPPVVVQSRPLSLASLFRRPTGVPPPAVVASVSKLEAEADAHPEDVDKQIALFDALVNTKVKPGLNTVVARWERTCEFVSNFMVASCSLAHDIQNPEHPLIRSETAFKLYLTALRDLGLETSITSAARRRDTLLAALSPASTAAPLSGVSTSAPVAPASADATPAEADYSFASESATSSSSPAAVSSSQQAAQEVLAGKETVARSTRTDLDALGAALGRGAGVPGNPIVVTLNEREFIPILSFSNSLLRYLPRVPFAFDTNHHPKMVVNCVSISLVLLRP